MQQGGLGGNDDRSKQIQSVAIFGCGGLGLSCIMIAAAAISEQKQLQIIAVDISNDALQKAQEIGATHTINSQIETNVQERIMEITNSSGADITIDAAGFKATSENAINCTRRGGRMVQVGLPIGGKPPIVPMGSVAGKELEIVGSHGCAASDMPKILSLIQSGRLDPKKLIQREVTLEEGARVLMDMDHGSPIGMEMITKFTTVPKSRY